MHITPSTHVLLSGLKLIAGVGAATVALVVSLYFLQPDDAAALTKSYGFWFLLATLVVFLMFSWNALKEAWIWVASRWTTDRWALLGLVGVAVFSHLHEPHRMKILADEAVISGTAMSMHNYRIVSVPLQAHRLADELQPLLDMPDKRPYLVPFLINVLHDLTGFRPENAFILNGLASFFLLCLLYYWGVSLGGVRMGMTLALLLAGIPLYSQLATAGGLEPVNAMLLVIFALTGLNYMKLPGATGLNLFVFSGILLAQARYESILYLAAIPILFLLKSVREKSLELTWIAAASPLLLMPPLLVQRVFQSNHIFFQLDETKSAFGVEFLGDNLSHAIHFFFSFSQVFANAPLISLCALIATLFAALIIFKGKYYSDALVVWGLLLLGTGVNFSILMFYFWGNLDDPVVSRLSLPLLIVGIMAAPFCLNGFFKSQTLPRWIPLVCLAHLATFTLSSNVKHQATMSLHSSSTLQFGLEQLAARPPEEANMIYSRSSVSYIAWGYPSSVDSGLYFRADSVNWIMENGLYDNVFVIQEYTINLQTGEEEHVGSVNFDDFFEKEVIAERWVYPRLVVRFSRVLKATPASPERLDAWREKYAIEDSVLQDMTAPNSEWPEGGFEHSNDYFEHWHNLLP